jgi:hypothetical protein
MIKFFRKIRYTSKEIGKTTKYFKYAIGEIILVVLGILIALQINNWNENRKQLNQGEEILVELKDELSYNINRFNGRTVRLRKELKAKKNLLKLKNLDNIPIDSIQYLLVDHTNLDVQPLQSTVDKIKNLGITRLTNNKNLNDSIYKYFERLDIINKSVVYYYNGFNERSRIIFLEQNDLALNFDELMQDYPGIEVPKFYVFDEVALNDVKQKWITFINQPRTQNLIKRSYIELQFATKRLEIYSLEMLRLAEQIQTELKKTKKDVPELPENLYILDEN